MSQLEARLQYGRSMHYVHDDFDGAQPRSGSRPVSLSDSDIKLMWDLFDYARISSRSECIDTDAAINFEKYSTEPVATNVPHTAVDDRNPTQNSTTIPATRLGHTEGAEMMLPDWDPILGNPGELNNDWSLFGTPWLGYFPS